MRLVYHIVFNCFSSSCSRFANCLLFNDSRWHLNRYCRVSFLYGRTKTRLDASWETLGSSLPRKKILGIPCLPTSLAFGFVLGAFATFAEPAIGVLRAAALASILLWHRYCGQYLTPVQKHLYIR